MLSTILLVVLVLMLLGGIAHLESQPKLGVFPKWRTGTRCRCADCTVTLRPNRNGPVPGF